VMERFHVDPDTGKARVEGAYDFGGQKYSVGPEGIKEQSGALSASAAPRRSAEQLSGKAPVGVDGAGRKVFWRRGRYEFEDGTPAQ